MRHGLSFDIECYYQIVARDYFNRWHEPTHEVVRNTQYLLDVLAAHDTHATFFVLGNVARRFPSLVRQIAEAGHELGVHGFDHSYLYHLNPESFRETIKRAVNTIEDASGAHVVGHRAPAFSVTPSTFWSLDVLREVGLQYDSSIFPIRGRRYGIPDAPLAIHQLSNGLYEVPLSAVPLGSRRLPVAGGGYVRYFPYQFTRWAIAHRERDGLPAIAYFHPYEFELRRPRVNRSDWALNPGQALKAFRLNVLQSMGRGTGMRRKLGQMLSDYQFVPIGTLLPGGSS